jgi:hypothetical protein
MIDAIWMPAATLGVLLLLMFGFSIDTSSRPVLNSATYGELRLGQSRSSVQSRLPALVADDTEPPEGAPADPPGTDECRFYRVRAQSLSPAYRLCFTGERLSHKDQVSIAQD